MTEICSNSAEKCYILNNDGQIIGEATALKDKIKPVELSKDTLESFIETLEEVLELQYQRIENTTNNTAYQTYADVVVGGKVVATIDNNGYVKSSNAIGAKISHQLIGSINGKEGPVLAQARAEQIAAMLGGVIKKSSTAISQSQYEILPKPKATINYEAMQKDPMYQALQNSKAKYNSLYLAQDIS
ncbi:MAG: hypothetical protein AB7U85_06165 [Alphaproteobacteria bacterium]